MQPVLSADAKAVLGSIFQHGMELRYQLIESRPTARMQAALDELVQAEMIVKANTVMRADGTCGVVYRARVPTESYKRFASKGKGIILAEPIPTTV